MRSIKIGGAIVMRRVPSGGRRPVAYIGRGAPIALLGYFGVANQTSTVAAGAVHACDVPNQVLGQAARSEPRIHRRITETAVSAAGNLIDWSASVREVGVVNQLAHVLLLLERAQGNTVVDLPHHEDLAGLLGARRETIARAFAALEAEGAVSSLDRRRCELAAGRLRERLALSAR